MNESIKYIGIDEKSFLKGQNYITVMTDTEGKRILDVSKNRTEESVNSLWERLSDKQKAGVEAVSMDFWEATINGAEKHMPWTDVVHDRFHIEKYLNESVDFENYRIAILFHCGKLDMFPQQTQKSLLEKSFNQNQLRLKSYLMQIN